MPTQYEAINAAVLEAERATICAADDAAIGTAYSPADQSALICAPIVATIDAAH